MTPEELHEVADLLYDADDPRATPWPSPERVGRLRSHLRGLADGLEETEGTDTDQGNNNFLGGDCGATRAQARGNPCEGGDAA